jgi:hypothetical protein
VYGIKAAVRRLDFAPALSASGLGDLVISAKHRFYRAVGPWRDRHAAVVRPRLRRADGRSSGENVEQAGRDLEHLSWPTTVAG